MIFAALLAMVATQEVAAGSQPAATILETTVPAGTPLRLTTVAAIDSRSMIQGQRVGLTIADDVLVGAKIVLPRGTPAVGEIDALTQKGMFGKAAKFSLRPLFIDIGGQRVNLTGRHVQHGKDGVAAAVVTTVILGGLGMIITGKNATLPANSVVYGEIKNDVVIVAIAPDGRSR